MKNLTCILLLSLIQLISFAQGFTSLDIIRSSQFYNNSFNNLNTTKHFDIIHPIQTIGLGLNGEPQFDGDSSKYTYFHLSYNQVLTDNLSIFDTITCRISGYSANVSYLAYTFFGTRKIFHFGISTIVNAGRLKLLGNETIGQKNAFLSLGLMLCPRIRMGRFTLSALSKYMWDISKPAWKKLYNSDENQPKLPDFRQSGLTIGCMVGYIIAHY